MAEHYVNSVASAAIPIAMTIEEVKQETAKGSTLRVNSLVRSNSGTTLHNIRVLTFTKQLSPTTGE